MPWLGGSALVVFAPHVGVDISGVVGKMNRRNMPSSGACCGSACAALAACHRFESGEEKVSPESPTDYIDSQQYWVTRSLLPRGLLVGQTDVLVISGPKTYLADDSLAPPAAHQQSK